MNINNNQKDPSLAKTTLENPQEKLPWFTPKIEVIQVDRTAGGAGSLTDCLGSLMNAE